MTATNDGATKNPTSTSEPQAANGDPYALVDVNTPLPPHSNPTLASGYVHYVSSNGGRSDPLPHNAPQDQHTAAIRQAIERGAVLGYTSDGTPEPLADIVVPDKPWQWKPTHHLSPLTPDQEDQTNQEDLSVLARSGFHDFVVGIGVPPRCDICGQLRGDDMHQPPSTQPWPVVTNPIHAPDQPFEWKPVIRHTARALVEAGDLLTIASVNGGRTRTYVVKHVDSLGTITCDVHPDSMAMALHVFVDHSLFPVDDIHDHVTTGDDDQ